MNWTLICYAFTVLELRVVLSKCPNNTVTNDKSISTELPQNASASDNVAPLQLYDVAIVGAGISGLTAAYELRRERPELKVLLLEARNRVGGRIHSRQLITPDRKSHYVDVGSQWIGSNHLELQSLLSDLQVPIRKQSICGNIELLVERGFQRHRRHSEFNELLTVRTFPQLLAQPFVRSLDAVSVADFLGSGNMSASVKEAINRLLQTLYDAPAPKVAAAQLFVTTASDNSTVDELLVNTGHGASYLPTNSMHSAISKLSKNAEIRLNSPVLRITVSRVNRSEMRGNEELDSAVYALIDTSSRTYRARDVILAVPPLLLSKIAFSPTLPLARQRIYEQYSPKGNAHYFVAIYESAFWRDANQNGQVIYSDATTTGPILWMTTFDTGNVDDSKECSSSADVGILFGIAHFSEKASLKQRDRYQQYTTTIGKMFGEKALKPLNITDIQWSDEKYSLGSIGVFGANVELSQMKPDLWVETHAEVVHFAGAELASTSTGLMNGAVASARAAIKEVLRARQSRIDAQRTSTTTKTVGVSTVEKPAEEKTMKPTLQTNERTSLNEATNSTATAECEETKDTRNENETVKNILVSGNESFAESEEIFNPERSINIHDVFNMSTGIDQSGEKGELGWNEISGYHMELLINQTPAKRRIEIASRLATALARLLEIVKNNDLK